MPDVLRDLEVRPLELPRHHAERPSASCLQLEHQRTVLDMQRLEVEPVSNLGHFGEVPSPDLGIVLGADVEEGVLHVNEDGRRQAARLGAAQGTPQPAIDNDNVRPPSTRLLEHQVGDRTTDEQRVVRLPLPGPGLQVERWPIDRDVLASRRLETLGRRSPDERTDPVPGGDQHPGETEERREVATAVPTDDQEPARPESPPRPRHTIRRHAEPIRLRALAYESSGEHAPDILLLPD